MIEGGGKREREEERNKEKYIERKREIKRKLKCFLRTLKYEKETKRMFK